MSKSTFHLFECVGFEVEYQLVSKDTLDVWPHSDAVLRTIDNKIESDIDRGTFSWSNELVSHLIEVKTTEPVEALAPLEAVLPKEVTALSDLLSGHNACLLPTGTHPWMNPAVETRLWEHEGHEIYQTFDSIFNCKTHGWANAQSIHINLPFCGEDEFARLHAAARFVLPILPAIAASTPLREGKTTGILDNRLVTYISHTERVPMLTGEVIPEAVYSIEAYHSVILEGIYQALKDIDTEQVLRNEWANARGAIARFDRSSIELRLLDSQECPSADLGVASFVVGLMQLLVEEQVSSLASQKEASVASLRAILDTCIRDAEEARIDDASYLSRWGYPNSSATAQELLRFLFSKVTAQYPKLLSDRGSKAVQRVLEHGSLARRILHAVGTDVRLERCKEVYRELARCLVENRQL